MQRRIMLQQGQCVSIDSMLAQASTLVVVDVRAFSEALLGIALMAM